MRAPRGTFRDHTSGATGRAIPPLALGVLALCAASTAAAYRARGMVVGGLLLDPFCSYSAVALPGMAPAPLRFPDRLVAVDGAPARCAGDAFPSDGAERQVRALHGRGVREATLEFARGAEHIRVRRRLTTLGSGEVARFWALYFLAGLLVAWSGMAVLAVTRAASGRAYAVAALGTFLFLAAFFDYHTTRLLVPFFSVGTALTGAGCLLLAIHFPEAPDDTRAGRALSAASLGVSGALAAVLVAAPRLDVDVTGARVLASLFAPGAGVVLFCSAAARRSRGDPASHRHTRKALVGMLVTLIVIGVGVYAAVLTGSTAIHALMPIAVTLTPLSVGWAIARHSALGADVVLTRRLLAPPTAVLSAGIALAAWLTLRSGRGDLMETWLPVAAAAAVAVAFFVAARRAIDAALFPARREFRPTIQLLAESLTGVSRRDELERALVDTVLRWLPSARVEVLAPGGLGGVDGLPAGADAALRAGRVVWTDGAVARRLLLVPMVSQSTLRGVLAVAPKNLGALFTEDDLALLDTIAGLGAVALHNVAVVAELDALRRIELDATRGDKALSLWLLADQVQHEMANPLNFVRTLLRHGARAPLDEEDVREGQGEIARMERMIAALRTLEFPRGAVEAVPLAGPAARALLLVRELLDARRVRHAVDLPEPCVVRADFDKLVQVFVNLLRNAAQAAPEGGRVGVSARLAGHDLVVDVWDDGPGVPADRVDLLFKRWVTSRAAEGGKGLGLALAQEFVTKFGWRIDYVREPGRTCFRIVVPARDVAGAAAEAATHADPRR